MAFNVKSEIPFDKDTSSEGWSTSSEGWSLGPKLGDPTMNFLWVLEEHLFMSCLSLSAFQYPVTLVSQVRMGTGVLGTIWPLHLPHFPQAPEPNWWKKNLVCTMDLCLLCFLSSDGTNIPFVEASCLLPPLPRVLLLSLPHMDFWMYLLFWNANATNYFQVRVIPCLGDNSFLITFLISTLIPVPHTLPTWVVFLQCDSHPVGWNLLETFQWYPAATRLKFKHRAC